MAFAVIKAAGKQYLVTEGQQVQLDKKFGAIGETVTFDTILLTADADGENVKMGQPVLQGVTVEGTVMRTGRSRKVRVTHYKPKIRYHKERGHRQDFTVIKITTISGITAKKAAPKVEKKEVTQKPTTKADVPVTKKTSEKTAAKTSK